MSDLTDLPVVGTLLTTQDELHALPTLSVVLADPDGLGPREDDHRLSMQKRPGGDGCSDYWFLARDGIFSVLAAEEAVDRFRLGPFLVLWIPPVATLEAVA